MSRLDPKLDRLMVLSLKGVVDFVRPARPLHPPGPGPGPVLRRGGLSWWAHSSCQKTFADPARSFSGCTRLHFICPGKPVKAGFSLASLMLTLRQASLALLVFLTPWPAWKPATPRRRWLVRQVLEAEAFGGWTGRWLVRRLEWLLFDRGSGYAADPSLAPGLVRAAVTLGLSLDHDRSMRVLQGLLRAGSLDLASFGIWFSTDRFWEKSASPHPRHVCTLVPALKSVPPLELADWLDVMGQRFPGPWTPLSVLVGRDGTEAFVNLLLEHANRLPTDTALSVVMDAGERLGRWLETHFQDRHQHLEANPLVPLLLSMPPHPTLRLRAWCSGVAQVFFREIQMSHPWTILHAGGVSIPVRNIVETVAVDGELIEKVPWLAPLQHGKHDLRVLLDHHPFWPTCLPERVMGDVLDEGLRSGTNPARRVSRI